MYKTQPSATEYTLVSGLHRSGSESAVLCVTLETPASSTGGYRLELNRQGFPIFMQNTDTRHLPIT